MSDPTTKSMTAEDLDRQYSDAEQCDRDLFSEMRSNLLLISGEHYNKKRSTMLKRIRDSKELTQEQKLRLTKNHIQKITKTYANNIIAMAPGVGFEPKNESELQDQKSAQLHHGVWRDACEKYGIETDLVDDWADDFVGVGEVACKIFFDPSIGAVKGYNQAVDEMGQPVFDQMGQPAPDMSSPVFEGGFVFETIQGFNLLRAPEAKTMAESPYLIIRKMVDVSLLKKKYPELESKIVGSLDETMVVFDSAKNRYTKAGSQVMVREHYYRPCMEYPRGWFVIAVKNCILEEDELPGGVFPIVSRAFDKIQTTPRGRGPVKVMRPYQAEINRAASKMAEHQITLGDDKLLIQNNTKVSEGVALPGIRSINYTGMAPTVLNGRDGSQYLAYMQAQILEMYQVMNVMEDSEEKSGQMDPYVLLFKSASQKKKFQRYIRRFESFLMDVARTYLKLAKLYLPDDAVIRAVGKGDIVNIQEFKNANDLSYEIVVTPQSDDIESKLGKQLVLNHALQYVGQKLNPEDIGKLMRQMPYANFDASFDDMTMDYDCATNFILSLERGEIPQVHPEDNFVYLAKRLVSRKRQADFRFLDPEVQNAFNVAIQACNIMESQRLLKLQRIEQGFIPTGGYLVACDFYTPDPADPAKTKRVRLPSQAVEWVIKTLEAQGQPLEQLEAMNGASQMQISDQMASQGMPPAGNQGQMVPAAG
jgi:hypothetical protein